MAVDVGQHVRVAHRARFHQIHSPAQQGFQCRLGAKESIQTGLRAGRELHQKVRIAVRGVEVIGPRPRAKYFQALDAVALADGGDAGAVLGDGGVHWAPFTCGVFVCQPL